ISNIVAHNFNNLFDYASYESDLDTTDKDYDYDKKIDTDQESDSESSKTAFYNKVSKEKRVYLKYQLPYFGNVKKSKLMLPSPYSNIGCIPANILPVKTINNAKSFIQEMRKQHGDSEFNKITIRKLFKDVYDECTLLKHALNENINYVNEDLNEKLANHISDYQKIREIYEDDNCLTILNNLED
ncbi:4501_t:CDS:2, partial [Dentiscutata heterogama]